MEEGEGILEDGSPAAVVEDRTVVHYLNLRDRPGSCGYCETTGSISQGMMVKKMTVQDYQDLLDRGWRRSGRYVYKPLMESTCCPLYTIRCPASSYAPSKSQRKVVKRFNNFLQNGTKEEKEPDAKELKKEEKHDDKMDTKVVLGSEINLMKRMEGLKKKKILRRERKLNKMSPSGPSKMVTKAPSAAKNRPKTMSDLLPSKNYMRLNNTLEQEVSPGAKHRFSLRLVRASMEDVDFMTSFEESYSVYRSYQLTIHKDPPAEVDMQSYVQFLCASPLLHQTRDGVELGAFHQHYLVDGKIVAVAVLDILPACLSSVYLYYDPSFWGSKLSPGTYSAIREIQLTQELGKLLPSLQYYYMGFYIHSCPKMKYKGQFLPSHLLSPSQLSWHSLTSCLPLLQVSKYCSLQEVEETSPAPPCPNVDVGRVGLLVGKVATTWEKVGGKDPVPERLAVYRKLVGQTLAEKMLLYWESDEETDSDSE